MAHQPDDKLRKPSMKNKLHLVIVDRGYKRLVKCAGRDMQGLEEHETDSARRCGTVG